MDEVKMNQLMQSFSSAPIPFLTQFCHTLLELNLYQLMNLPAVPGRSQLQLLQVMQACPLLHSLRLWDSPFDLIDMLTPVTNADGMKPPYESFPQMSVLELNQPRYEIRAADLIALGRIFPCLVSFQLSSMQSIDSLALEQCVRSLPKLRRFSISYSSYMLQMLPTRTSSQRRHASVDPLMPTLRAFSQVGNLVDLTLRTLDLRLSDVTPVVRRSVSIQKNMQELTLITVNGTVFDTNEWFDFLDAGGALLRTFKVHWRSNHHGPSYDDILGITAGTTLESYDRESSAAEPIFANLVDLEWITDFSVSIPQLWGSNEPWPAGMLPAVEPTSPSSNGTENESTFTSGDDDSSAEENEFEDTGLDYTVLDQMHLAEVGVFEDRFQKFILFLRRCPQLTRLRVFLCEYTVSPSKVNFIRRLQSEFPNVTILPRVPDRTT